MLGGVVKLQAFHDAAGLRLRERFRTRTPCGGCSEPAPAKAGDLLAAKRDFALPRQLRKLDNFDILLLDDLGYLPQSLLRA